MLELGIKYYIFFLFLQVILVGTCGKKIGFLESISNPATKSLCDHGNEKIIVFHSYACLSGMYINS